MARDKNHPVWDVYDLYRTARLNVKYYCGRLHKLQRLNFWMEFALAATASSSAIAGFTLWKTTVGGWVWQTLGVSAAILAIMKPLLNLSEKIRKMEEIVTGYRVLEHDLRKIEVAIRQRRIYDKELYEKFSESLDRMDNMVMKNVENSEDKTLKKKCQDEVLKELPSKHFYIPQRPEHE